MSTFDIAGNGIVKPTQTSVALRCRNWENAAWCCWHQPHVAMAQPHTRSHQFLCRRLRCQTSTLSWRCVVSPLAACGVVLCKSADCSSSCHGAAPHSFVSVLMPLLAMSNDTIVAMGSVAAGGPWHCTLQICSDFAVAVFLTKTKQSTCSRFSGGDCRGDNIRRCRKNATVLYAVQRSPWRDVVAFGLQKVPNNKIKIECWRLETSEDTGRKNGKQQLTCG